MVLQDLDERFLGKRGQINTELREGVVRWCENRERPFPLKRGDQSSAGNRIDERRKPRITSGNTYNGFSQINTIAWSRWTCGALDPLHPATTVENKATARRERECVIMSRPLPLYTEEGGVRIKQEDSFLFFRDSTTSAAAT